MKNILLILFVLLSSVPLHAQKAKGTATPIAKQNATVYDSPEQKTYFPFGMDSIDHFIKHNIHFNDAGDKIGGKAVVVFIVEKDGKIGNAEILSTSGNKEFDKEAVRVVKTIPKWMPAKNKGKAVRSSAMLSVLYQVR